MNKNRLLLPLVAISLMVSCQKKPTAKSQVEHSDEISIAFGSCGHQDKPMPMLDIATNLNPDAFVYLGDNIYGDTRLMDTLRAKYGRLGLKKEFKNLKAHTKLYATWDDHDYGENDAGRHYPFREESKQIFMDFWEVPENSERRKHDGIYGVEYIQKGDLKVQLVLLDTRSFRDNLVRRQPQDTLEGHKNDYIPNDRPESTVLGDQQWNWLKQVLEQPADIRIMASSIQFSHQYNGWESWTNVPHEQQKMLDLIKSTGAEGTIFISGDVHWGEISKMDNGDGYPIYDVTSSGITQTWDIVEPNKNRIGKPVPHNNIGLIEITKFNNEIGINLSLIDSTARKVVQHSISKHDLVLK